ncbi:UDP-N-acetylmuramoyl-L-alanyl-D-glutamate--2,6-diaminopimelate ligase [Pedobacter cryotolerans]|uniref:UDP-N-acetylmuramoyl-L-alanyl-D-glutamate--2,6-diaminopimelate ligase n=1 Tax=Pedobacter cryotolerans TaxID=2571270 RepID=A0A4U1C075_9SPHI|nr:UDP-N-acetylmuramoyl-L-alanyl-D-glutamate--2,6-diaminopimelate ligase [Pedobacter cryotolerans]TKB98258.1 UDP-N-acetylmuramoyl-L-alanyl-D-glutamate--2,6-diaminopimelate ligase [Pedobacter cryotolerans]
MKLQDLLYGVAIKSLVGQPDIEVADLALDSRAVKNGTMFFAIKGTAVDGHQFIAQTAKAGAAAIICEEMPAEFTDLVTYVQVENSSVALGQVASNFYGNPSTKLKLIGITGTNGKTTIATLLFQLFRELGYNVGLISTVQNHINDNIIPSTHTTPNPIALNALLNDMVKAKCEYCFMEVSSHAVVQHRIEGLNFVGGIFSNITHDHLDFHKTFDSYLKAKKTFFDQLPKSTFALTNADDKNGMVMLQNTKASKKSYALKQMADFKAKVVENKFSGLHLDIDETEVFFKMVGSFNAYNLLAAYGTAILLDQDKLTVLTILSTLAGAEGRFDYTVAKSGVIGIVDYAHTPDAVQNVLSTIANIRKGTEQVITVLGCGGDRDKTKRPIMAQVACDWSDKVILTSDNPRTENPQEIIAEMEKGVSPTNQRKTLSIADRREAIKTACHLANPGDIILVAGKGHEKYQEINGVKHHFDDKEVLTEQLNQIN